MAEIEQKEEKEIEIPDNLPVLPVRDIVVFPYMILPLFVGREMSIKSIEHALSSNRMVLLITQMDLSVETPAPEDLYSVGTVGVIMRMLKLPDGRVKILVQGVSKAGILDFIKTEPFYTAALEKVTDQKAGEMTIETEAIIRSVKEQLDKAVSLGKTILPDIMVVVENLDDPDLGLSHDHVVQANSGIMALSEGILPDGGIDHAILDELECVGLVASGRLVGDSAWPSTREANEHVLVVPILETVKTVKQVPLMCHVEGSELFFFGPADFSSTAGARGQWEGPGVAEQILQMKDILRRAGKNCGLLATSHENMLERRQQGFRMIGLGMDTGLLLRSLRGALSLVGRDSIQASLAPESATSVRPLPRPPESMRPDRPEVMNAVGTGPKIELTRGVTFECLFGGNVSQNIFHLVFDGPLTFQIQALILSCVDHPLAAIGDPKSTCSSPRSWKSVSKDTHIGSIRNQIPFSTIHFSGNPLSGRYSSKMTKDWHVPASCF